MTTFLRDTPVALSPQIAKTLKNTFITLASMMSITAVAAFFSLGLRFSTFGFAGLFIASLGLLLILRRYQDSSTGLLILGAYSALSGMLIGPVLNYYLSLAAGPSIVMTAAGLTALVCVACAIAVQVTGKSFSNLRVFLFVSTLVLIVGYLISWFVAIPALSLGLTIIGVVLFSGWLLMDLGTVMTGVQTNYIMAASSIYLSILNLFMHLLRLVGFLSSD